MILLESGGKVLIGGVGTLIEDDREFAWAEKHVVQQNPGLAWILGNFVEADNANNNGHIFDLEELQSYSTKTIPHTPVNMLHRPHYIVGNLVAAELLYPMNAEADAAGSPAHPYVEALTAFYRYYFPDEYTTVKAAHGEGALFYCVDDETELLTASGWKHRFELTVGEDILTLNRTTGLSEWLPLDRLHQFEARDVEMQRMEGQTFSSLSTLNHRWWVWRRPHRGGDALGGYEVRTTEELTNECYIPRCAPHGGFPAEAKHSDAFVELVGWFWTEGSINQSNGITIYQSETANPSYCARIRRSCSSVFGAPNRVRDGGLWYETLSKTGVRSFHLCKEASASLLDAAPDKVLSGPFLRQLTEAQLRLLIDTSVDGDGTIAKADGQVSLSQRSLDRIRGFEMACVLAGIPTNTTLGKNGMWRTCLLRRSNRIAPLRLAHMHKGFEVERVRYTGMVWCPETPNQTFFARRGGSVYLSMNSMECVPSHVKCMLEGGCGKEFAYDGRLSDTYCAHLNQPRAPKLLKHPTFTGAGLIIPPVKPGWNRADARFQMSALLEERALEVEMAYDQLSHEFPHLESRQWEQMMSALLRNGYGASEGEQARDFSTADRKALAKKGHALPDGSFPIETPGDLANAIQAIGRANPADRAKVKAHIRKRAAALGKSDLVPDSWNS